MDKNYFENEKLQYENIEIPEELDFMVKKTLKEGKRRRDRKIVYKYTSGIAASFLAFVLLVNMFPKVAYAASLIPGVDKLVEFVTFDKGFTNAVDKGLTKELNYIQEKDGVKLIVNGLAGDYKRLWIGYELIGNDNYEIQVNIKDSLTGEDVPVGISFGNPQITADSGNGYLEIAFQEFVENFNLNITVGKKGVSEEVITIEEGISKDDEEGTYFERNNIGYVTAFNVPITLEKEVFGNMLKEVKLDNYIMNTDIFDIKLKKIETSKTRIVMTLNLESDEYEYMGFKNPKLIDDKGNEYITSSFYFSENELKDKCIEFSGEISDDIKSLKFICDGVYYAKKDERDISVDLIKGDVEENPYGIEFVSFKNKVLTLRTTNVESLSFEEILDENGEYIVSTRGLSTRGNEEEGTYEVLSYLKVEADNIEELGLKVRWILKDRTEGIEVELIK